MAFLFGYYLGMVIGSIVVFILACMALWIVFVSVRGIWRLMTGYKKPVPEAPQLPKLFDKSAVADQPVEQAKPAPPPSAPTIEPVPAPAPVPTTQALPEVAVSAADERSALLAFCRELLADDVLDEAEARALHAWFKAHPAAIDDELAGLLALHLDAVLADDEVTIEELFDLQDILEALVHDVPLRFGSWRDAIADDVPAKPRRAASRTRKRQQAGRTLDTIRFEYCSALGEVSQRRVVVRVIEDEYFEGRCLTRNAMRTFRFDRVQGDITSEESGEVANPYDWAAGIEAANTRIKT